MKSILLYVIVLLALLALFANEVLSKPVIVNNTTSEPEKTGGKALSAKPGAVGKKGFCKGKTLSDGTQIKKGSCSTTIQGNIPNVNAMTSSFITFPDNEAVLEPDTAFNVKVAINNLETGFFSDPEKQYNLFPQDLNKKGIIKGHSHVTIQQLSGLSPPDAINFAFFKGLNEKGDILITEVIRDDGTPGLPAGKYRICSMSGAFSHQPLIMPVAKRGAQDDCIRITVGTPEHPFESVDDSKVPVVKVVESVDDSE